MQDNDQIEFSFLGIRGRAHGRFGIAVLAGVAIVAMIAALFVFRFH